MTVQVAIDLALDRLFTYEVPEALQKKLAVGQLLSVPFGHREARGFALEVAREDVRRETEDGFCLSSSVSRPPLRLKSVSAIVDETPFFSPKLLELVRQVAAYTAAPIETVLKTALPAAVLKRNARAKEQLFVENNRITELPNNRIEGLGLTKRQRWLAENIVRLGGGWMSFLCKELKTTPASIRTLAERGLVKVEVRAMRRNPLAGGRILPTKPLPLNAEQQAALEAIVGHQLPTTNYQLPTTNYQLPTTIYHLPTLLFGVTGSGKTEVYLQAIAAELAAGRGAIVMVPEIALTPQTVRRFASRFGDQVAVLHSALSDGERYDEWHRIRAGTARVVIGPRSAVWAPVRNLGLIVVDEEHESSYKQDETPRYHARDVAVLRGKLEGARVVLGSATPSLESWANVSRGKYALAEMKCRAGAGTLPNIKLVEMSGGAIFSPDLLEALRIHLDRHEQAILFLNRRGYSRAFVCGSCGHAVECPSCGVPYTYHRADACLRCHICGGWIPLPEKCPDCGCPHFDFKGIGTQRAEAALQKCFPRAKILRMDADSTTRRHSHDEILSAFRRGEADILLGTQMIAKGLDFPNVTLVGVLNADSALQMADADFRAAERTYQLISQVAGRAGRAELPGEVIVQSYDPSVPVIRRAAAGDYAGFAADELSARKDCHLPPFCHLAVIVLSSASLKLASSWADMYAQSLRNYFQTSNLKPQTCLVSDAMPCALEKAADKYRWQVSVRTTSVSAIVGAWRWLQSVRPLPRTLGVSLDVDAYSLL